MSTTIQNSSFSTLAMYYIIPNGLCSLQLTQPIPHSNKGQLLFLDPFEIELAIFLKLTLVKGWPLFWDPFEIGVAAFLEISISNCVFHIWNLMKSIFEAWLIPGSISIFGLQLHHIMASNGNKYKEEFSGGITSSEFS